MTPLSFSRSSKRTIVLASTLALLASGWACTPLKPVGKPCALATECESKLTCFNSVCTATCTADSQCGAGLACGAFHCEKACTAQSDCPTGEECALAAAADTSATCFIPKYTQPAMGGFGTTCSLYACGQGSNPCANGFTCFSQDMCDPDALCTQTCGTDLDCPANFWCAATTDSSGKSQQTCLPRGRCDPCATDDACQADYLQADYVCAHDNIGGRFCAQPCNSTMDCLKPYNAETASGGTEYLGNFETCEPDGMSSRTVCTPGTGACHGKSAITAISGNGEICSPCRPGISTDCSATTVPGCTVGSGATQACYPCLQGQSSDCSFSEFCHEVTTPGEEYCSEPCWVGLDYTDQGYNMGGDTCPSGSFCFYGGPGALGDILYGAYENGATGCGPCVGASSGACNCDISIPGTCDADSNYLGDTCYPTPSSN